MKYLSKMLIITVLFSMWFCSAKEDDVAIMPKNKTVQKQDALESVYINRQTALTTAIEEVAPAVVGIHVTQIKKYAVSRGFNDPVWDMLFGKQIYKEKVPSMGSGVIISEDGYVVTNAHVVENAVEIIITLSGGEKYDAEVVGSDNLTDIALLKINENRVFPFVKTGNSDDILIGEWVIALGNPFGLFDVNNKPTATVGIVSSLHLDFGEQKSGRVYQDMIQTDASINTGNSGGALVNVLGELIGINTFIFTGNGNNSGSVGIGFAIPSNRVSEIINELKTTGKIERGFETGLSVQNIDRFLAAYLKLPQTTGVIITNVEEGSSADKAGLAVGDVIVEVNRTTIINRQDILRIINEGYLKAGDQITLHIWRNGDTLIRELILEKPN